MGIKEAEVQRRMNKKFQGKKARPVLRPGEAEKRGTRNVKGRENWPESKEKGEQKEGRVNCYDFTRRCGRGECWGELKEKRRVTVKKPIKQKNKRKDKWG